MPAFDLSSNTAAQRAVIEAAVDRCDFDFTRILPRLTAEQNRAAVPVTWEDLSQYRGATSGANTIVEPGDGHDHDHPEQVRRATLGLAYYSGRIVVEQTLIHRLDLAQIIFLAEAAHMVDFFVLTPEQRARIFDLFHPPGAPEHGHGWFDETGNADYWSWVGEAWMYGFIRAFTDIEPDAGGMVHELAESNVAAVRGLLGVRPPPAPVPVPVCASRYSVAYHRPGAHWWLPCARPFPSREDAEMAGLRPCRLCKP